MVSSLSDVHYGSGKYFSEVCVHKLTDWFSLLVDADTHGSLHKYLMTKDGVR